MRPLTQYFSRKVALERFKPSGSFGFLRINCKYFNLFRMMAQLFFIDDVKYFMEFEVESIKSANKISYIELTLSFSYNFVFNCSKISSQVLSERLAIMLNFNVKQLTGAKCKNLKVISLKVSLRSKWTLLTSLGIPYIIFCIMLLNNHTNQILIHSSQSSFASFRLL